MATIQERLADQIASNEAAEQAIEALTVESMESFISVLGAKKGANGRFVPSEVRLPTTKQGAAPASTTSTEAEKSKPKSYGKFVTFEKSKDKVTVPEDEEPDKYELMLG